MKTLVKLEELAQALFSIYLFSLLPFAWWVYPLLILTPDLSLIALLAGKRIGVIIYNLIHHKAVALTVYVLGALFDVPILSLIGILLFGHSSFDRVLGLHLMDVTSESKRARASIDQTAWIEFH